MNLIFSGNVDNAYWSSSLQQLVFGDDGNYAAALDVVSHEFTHAVINHVVGDGLDETLTYSGESGALNEAYATLGNLIEGESGNWLLGEDSDQTLRNMSDPSQYNQPEHYSDRYTGTQDKGGVHINSGIFNFAAFKMITDSRTSSITSQTWAKVFYKSLFRLTTNATFLDARGAVIASAKVLGFDQTQQQAIKDAFDAVGIVESDTIRIVLRWGATPADLDSHLTGPAVSGSSRFHIWYAERNYYTDGGYYATDKPLVADLDWDDVNSYGPEIMTIRQLTPGDYYFYVHDYTNHRLTSSTALANSGANVNIYKGTSNTPIQTFNVNGSSNGNLWNVFKLTISSNGNVTMTDIDTYNDSFSPTSIGN